MLFLQRKSSSKAGKAGMTLLTYNQLSLQSISTRLLRVGKTFSTVAPDILLLSCKTSNSSDAISLTEAFSGRK